MNTKRCSKCDLDKLIPDDFRHLVRSKDGFRGQCKDCDRVWYQGNRKKHMYDVKLNNRRYLVERRRWLCDYLLNHPCVDCGEEDIVVLDFDHRDPKLKSFTIASKVHAKAVSALRAEVEKCDVRCRNCHARKTARDGNWWKMNYQELRGQADKASVS